MAEQDPDTIELVADPGAPFAAMGRTLAALRKAKGLTQKEVAARGGLASNNRVSDIEQGLNVQLSQLHGYAVGLGYRSIMELFRAPTDPQLRKLLRLWAVLDSAERTDVLARVWDWTVGKLE